MAGRASLTAASAGWPGRRFDARVTRKNRRVSPWTARDSSGQQTGRNARKRSVGACATVAWAGSGVRGCVPNELEVSARVAQASAVYRRAAQRASAASQALGLDSKRTWRRGSGVRVDIRLVSLDASRSGCFCSGKPFEWVRSCCSAACVASCTVTWGRCPPVAQALHHRLTGPNGPGFATSCFQWVRRGPWRQR